MSTGANCRFVQKGKTWTYELQDYPYGMTESYQTYGPFVSYRAARDHLRNHHANPGGWSVQHDKKCPCNHPKEMREEGWQGATECGQCGQTVEEITLKPSPLNETKIKLIMGKRTHKEVEELELSVFSARLNWDVLNVKFTQEGIVADRIRDGEVVSSFCQTYDEFVELLK